MHRMKQLFFDLNCIDVDCNLHRETLNKLLKDRKASIVPVILSSHNLQSDWARDLIKPSEDAKNFVI